MAQCIARSKRSGERCKRIAPPGSATCFYHGAGPVKRARPAETPTSGGGAFTTKELSKRTWSDFETLFAEGTGWGRCACLASLRRPRASRKVARTWADQRSANLGIHHGLVEEGRAHGILVYAAGAPIGWCQFGRADDLRHAAAGADWRVTCFVTDPSHRGRGVMGVALGAAVEAIRRKGGGIVEGYPCAIAPGEAPRDEQWLSRDESGRLRRNPNAALVRRDGDVAFYAGIARVRFGVDVEGVGPVAAMYRQRTQFYSGTVDLFGREGFEAVAVLPRPTSPAAQLLAPDRVVMRRSV
jgi:GNAT superfamily N-acetyltransferase